MKLIYSSLFLILFSCTHKKTTKNATIEETNFCSKITQQTITPLSKELHSISEKMNTETGVYVLESGNESLILIFNISYSR